MEAQIGFLEAHEPLHRHQRPKSLSRHGGKRRANLWRPPLEGGLEAEGACVEESVARPLPIDPVVLLESRPDFYIKKTRAAAVPHKLRRE